MDRLPNTDLVKRIGSAVVITDRSGAIEWISEGFTTMTGYELKEVIGRKPGTFLQGPETNPETIQLLRNKIVMGEPVAVELVNYKKTGEKYHVYLEITPLPNANNTIEHFISIQLNITEQKKREEILQHKNKIWHDVALFQAHEFRHQLSNAIGLLHLLPIDHGDAEYQNIFRLLLQSINELDAITRMMLSTITNLIEEDTA